MSAKSFNNFWNHPAGPKTIHFWAPMFKWGLVIAGLADINRPVEKISLFQTCALAATGLIWARYSTQITPINYNLMAVNLFVGGTGIYQLCRVGLHNDDLTNRIKSNLGLRNGVVKMEWQTCIKEAVKTGFKDSNTKISKEALKALEAYVELFIQEAIARAEAKCPGETVELEQIEQIFLQLILDFS